ncbi:hypothetical protein [Selenomonas flueggei]|uniref:Uncharacterized protein n=1 Tax=Selenomonas flueggei ATCC 43531 TaxID=638302 RepID=C4V2T1_9FIRM|nr:hypothetical protein [Selenomonas flueggei]EEQ48873.1 hypothetical protein HMPREF0908_0901 [Selenomonas flueggei ATCC 43531]
MKLLPSQIIVLIITLSCMITASSAAAEMQDRPLAKVRYTDFVDRVNEMLTLEIFHTTLSPIRYDKNMSTAKEDVYTTRTNSDMLVAFYIQDGLVCSVGAQFNQQDKQRAREAVDVMAAVGLAMGMTPDEVRQVLNLKPFENALCGKAHCIRTGTDVYLVTTKHGRDLFMAVYADPYPHP